MRTVETHASRVKPVRRYSSPRRREQAVSTHDRVLKAAERRFLRDGYTTTTIAAIAEDAAVSVDTVYKSFGGKPGLVRAIRTRALRGDAATPAEERSDQLQAREPDARKIIRGWGRFVAELAPRAAPILLLVRDAAATDPELRQLQAELDGDRLKRMTANARRLRAAGHLRRGVTVSRAADVLWTYSSPELYELLVLRRGMPLRRYAEFVADAMTDALL
jgi:AcrR family transcriptional regulator